MRKSASNKSSKSSSEGSSPRSTEKAESNITKDSECSSRWDPESEPPSNRSERVRPSSWDESDEEDKPQMEIQSQYSRLYSSDNNKRNKSVNLEIKEIREQFFKSLENEKTNLDSDRRQSPARVRRRTKSSSSSSPVHESKNSVEEEENLSSEESDSGNQGISLEPKIYINNFLSELKSRQTTYIEEEKTDITDSGSNISQSYAESEIHFCRASRKLSKILEVEVEEGKKEGPNPTESSFITNAFQPASKSENPQYFQLPEKEILFSPNSLNKENLADLKDSSKTRQLYDRLRLYPNDIDEVIFLTAKSGTTELDLDDNEDLTDLSYKFPTVTVVQPDDEEKNTGLEEKLRLNLGKTNNLDRFSSQSSYRSEKISDRSVKEIDVIDGSPKFSLNLDSHRSLKLDLRSPETKNQSSDDPIRFESSQIVELKSENESCSSCLEPLENPKSALKSSKELSSAEYQSDRSELRQKIRIRRRLAGDDSSRNLETKKGENESDLRFTKRKIFHRDKNRSGGTTSRSSETENSSRLNKNKTKEKKIELVETNLSDNNLNNNILPQEIQVENISKNNETSRSVTSEITNDLKHENDHGKISCSSKTTSRSNRSSKRSESKKTSSQNVSTKNSQRSPQKSQRSQNKNLKKEDVFNISVYPVSGENSNFFETNSFVNLEKQNPLNPQRFQPQTNIEVKSLPENNNHLSPKRTSRSDSFEMKYGKNNQEIKSQFQLLSARSNKVEENCVSNLDSFAEDESLSNPNVSKISNLNSARSSIQSARAIQVPFLNLQEELTKSNSEASSVRSILKSEESQIFTLRSMKNEQKSKRNLQEEVNIEDDTKSLSKCNLSERTNRNSLEKIQNKITFDDVLKNFEERNITSYVEKEKEDAQSLTTKSDNEEPSKESLSVVDKVSIENSENNGSNDTENKSNPSSASKILQNLQSSDESVNEKKLTQTTPTFEKKSDIQNTEHKPDYERSIYESKLTESKPNTERKSVHENTESKLNSVKRSIRRNKLTDSKPNSDRSSVGERKITESKPNSERRSVREYTESKPNSERRSVHEFTESKPNSEKRSIHEYTESKPNSERRSVHEYTESKPNSERRSVHEYTESKPSSERRSVHEYTESKPDSERRSVHEYTESKPNSERRSVHEYTESKPSSERRSIHEYTESKPNSERRSVHEYTESKYNSEKRSVHEYTESKPSSERRSIHEYTESKPNSERKFVHEYTESKYNSEKRSVHEYTESKPSSERRSIHEYTESKPSSERRSIHEYTESKPSSERRSVHEYTEPKPNSERRSIHEYTESKPNSERKSVHEHKLTDSQANSESKTWNDLMQTFSENQDYLSEENFPGFPKESSFRSGNAPKFLEKEIKNDDLREFEEKISPKEKENLKNNPEKSSEKEKRKGLVISNYHIGLRSSPQESTLEHKETFSQEKQTFFFDVHRKGTYGIGEFGDVTPWNIGKLNQTDAEKPKDHGDGCCASNEWKKKTSTSKKPKEPKMQRNLWTDFNPGVDTTTITQKLFPQNNLVNLGAYFLTSNLRRSRSENCINETNVKESNILKIEEMKPIIEIKPAKKITDFDSLSKTTAANSFSSLSDDQKHEFIGMEVAERLSSSMFNIDVQHSSSESSQSEIILKETTRRLLSSKKDSQSNNWLIVSSGRHKKNKKLNKNKLFNKWLRKHNTRNIGDIQKSKLSARHRSIITPLHLRNSNCFKNFYKRLVSVFCLTSDSSITTST